VRNRFVCLLLTIILFFSFSTTVVYAEYEGKVNSDYAILLDADSGIILYEKDAHEKTYPASTTKILTCLTVLENCEDIRGTEVTVSKIIKEYGEGNSLMGLTVGEVLTVRDLLYGLMLCSGNDAAAVLAEFIGGSYEGFAELMNAKIEELGMKDTHFVTPHGLHDSEHYTTAYDMSILVRYAMQNGDLMAIVGRPTYDIPETNTTEARTLTTTNRFISPKSKYKDFNWDVVTGMKTGYTSKAGGCLVTTASDNGTNLICIIMGDRSGGQEDRWKDARNLLKYGFENMTEIGVRELNLELPSVNVSNASQSDEDNGVLQLVFAADDDTAFPCTLDTRNAILDDASTLSVQLNLTDTPTAPVEAGQLMGTAEVLNSGEVLGTVNVYAKRSVAEYVEPVATANPEDPGSTADRSSLLNGEVSPVAENGISWYAIAALVLAVLIVFAVILRLRVVYKRKKRRQAMNRARKRY